MTPSDRTKPADDVKSLLLDATEESGSKMLKLEPAEATPVEPRPFVQIQTHAWAMYIRAMVALHTRGSDRANQHASEKEAIDWLNSRLEPTSSDGSYAPRKFPHSYISTGTLAKIESVLPGSAEVYFWGPDLSVLWSALAGDDDGAAMERFKALTGLSSTEISNGPPEFFETLLVCHEPIALHALAAMLSSLWRRFPDFKEQNDLLAALDYRIRFNLNRDVRSKDDQEICELLADPWYARTIACLDHDATIGRLSAYGLARTDLLTVAGKPIVSPPKRKSFKFSVRSDVVDTILMERGATSSAPQIQGSLHPEQSTGDWISLGDFADYWHRKIYG